MAYISGRRYPKQWRVWKNASNQAKAIRKHLQSHNELWEDVIILKQLKHWQEVAKFQQRHTDSNGQQHEPFTLSGFYERLLRWIAIDDQVSSYSELMPLF